MDGTQREQQIADEQHEARIEAELDRLWAAYGSECPWADAEPEHEVA